MSTSGEKDEFGLPLADPRLTKRRETFWEKASREPLVPLFAAATLGVLGYGLYSFQSGNVATSQKMMRLRVLAQGACVAAMVGYVGLNGSGPIADALKLFSKKPAVVGAGEEPQAPVLPRTGSN